MSDHEDEIKLEAMRDELAEAIEGVRTESRDLAIDAVRQFAKDVDGKRSRKPPIPPKDDERREKKDETPKGTTIEFDHLRVLGDGRDQMYRRMTRGLDDEQTREVRCARNPRMDELTKAWGCAVLQGNVPERARLYTELNERWLDDLGYSRAPLLEGSPDADSGFADGTGAELLPLPLANQLMIERERASVMRRLVSVFPMSSQTERIPILPTVTASTRAENGTYTDNTPASDVATLSAKDLGVTFSAGRNFLEDTAFNMANALTVVAGQAIGEEEDIQICTSTANGADITEGLDAATITDVAEGTSTEIHWEDFVTVYYTLPQEYRKNASWFMAGTTLADVLNEPDGNGRPVFTSQFNAPVPISDTDPVAEGRIMGHAVYEVPVADDVIYFGDPVWYALGNRSGIRVDTERAVATGLRTWVIDERVDGRVIPTSVVGTNNAWRKVVY